MADYTSQEIARLQLGYMIREQGVGSDSSSTSALRERKAELEQNRWSARQDLLADLNSTEAPP